MEELVNRLREIKEQILHLKTQNDFLLKDQDRMDKEMHRLKQLVEIQNNSMKLMEQKLKIKHIADEVMGVEESKDSNRSREMKFKINEMIKEVDKIMTLLHQ